MDCEPSNIWSVEQDSDIDGTSVIEKETCGLE